MTNKILSIFVDESGDFGPYSAHSPYYLVSMVFHNQSLSIDSNILALEHHMNYLNFESHDIHTAPLIRRESLYKFYSTEIRKSLFNALYHFTRKLNIKYLCPVIHKNIQNSTKDEMIKQVSIEIYNTLNNHSKVELTKILTSVFNLLFINVEFRHVQPTDYRLSQVADLICTLELLAQKSLQHSFSSSEIAFFGSTRDFHRNYYRQIVSKKLVDNR